jgi:hypothetical protein
MNNAQQHQQRGPPPLLQLCVRAVAASLPLPHIPFSCELLDPCLSLQIAQEYERLSGVGLLQHEQHRLPPHLAGWGPPAPQQQQPGHWIALTKLAGCWWVDRVARPSDLLL